MPALIARTACAFVFGASIAAAVAPVAAQTDTADPVVATVNGVAVRRSDLEYERYFLPEQYRSVPIDVLYSVLLDQVIDGKLVALSGREAGLAEDEEVRSEMKRIEDRLVRQTYIQRYLASTVTEEDLQSRYDAMDHEAGRAEEIRASHILVETEAEAIAIIELLDGGADFANLAAEHSTGPSGKQGGDLGFFTREAMVAPFSDAAFALETGATTKAPVKTQFGWHVIKVEERRTSPAPTFEELRPELRQTATREAVETLLARLKGEATIERFNLDGTPIEEPKEQETSPN